ncbi:MAG: thioredoxin family protein [Candidatus Arcticimaribacter sp.]
MKYLFLLFVLFSAVLQAQKWEEDFEMAQEKAVLEEKKLLLVFSGSDWCIPCIRLEKEVWQDAVFLAYAKENLVLYRADFPKRKKNQLPQALKEKHDNLAAQYNPKGYFPWVVVFAVDKAVKGTFIYTKDPVSDYIEQIKSF